MSKEIIKFVSEQIGRPVPIITGTPDHRAIRKIESEIYGEPVSEYPGEWDTTTTQIQHYRRHVRGHSFSYETYYAGCLWCEDRRRDAVARKAVREAKEAAEARAGRWGVWMLIPAAGFVSAFTVLIIALVVWG